MTSISRISRVGLSLFAGLALATAAVAAPALPGSATIQYNPVLMIVQGNQPLTKSYDLLITGPSTLPLGDSVTVTLGFTVLNKPPGVSDATALSFISASPSTLTLTTLSPNAQPKALTTITVTVPLGSYAGDYAWLIKPLGWPASLHVTDLGATINATVEPPPTVSNDPPVVAIGSPADGTTFPYQPTPGTPVSFPIQFAASVAAGGKPIDTLGATFEGLPLTVTATGLGTLSASGTATSPNITSPGTYTIRVSATNAVGTSFATADINVVVSAPPPNQICADLNWLPPISLNRTIEGGSTMPIKFTLTCGNKFVRDTSVLIAIYELYADGSASTPTIHPYDTGSPNPPDYAINGNHYHLNFPTAKGVHRYRIEVYYAPTANPASLQLLGTKELNTK